MPSPDSLGALMESSAYKEIINSPAKVLNFDPGKRNLDQKSARNNRIAP
jgi:hypothetical protein